MFFLFDLDYVKPSTCDLSFLFDMQVDLGQNNKHKNCISVS